MTRSHTLVPGRQSMFRSTRGSANNRGLSQTSATSHHERGVSSRSEIRPERHNDSHSWSISSPKESKSSHHTTTTDGEGHTSPSDCHHCPPWHLLGEHNAWQTPANHQYRNNKRGQQQQRTGPAAPELKRSSTTPLATVPAQPQPREVCLPKTKKKDTKKRRKKKGKRKSKKKQNKRKWKKKKKKKERKKTNIKYKKKNLKSSRICHFGWKPMNLQGFGTQEHLSLKNTTKNKNSSFWFKLEFVNYNFRHIWSKGRPYRGEGGGRGKEEGGEGRGEVMGGGWWVGVVEWWWWWCVCVWCGVGCVGGWGGREGWWGFAHDANSANFLNPTKASAIHETIEVVWSMRLSRLRQETAMQHRWHVDDPNTVTNAKTWEQQHCRAWTDQHSEHCKNWEIHPNFGAKVTQSNLSERRSNTVPKTLNLTTRTESDTEKQVAFAAATGASFWWCINCDKEFWVSCRQKVTHAPDGLKICLCGIWLRPNQSTMDWRPFVKWEKGHIWWQMDRLRAVDAKRGAAKRREYTSFMDRWKNDEIYWVSQLAHGWTEMWVKCLDHMSKIDINHDAPNRQRQQHESTLYIRGVDSNEQAGPLSTTRS